MVKDHEMGRQEKLDIKHQCWNMTRAVAILAHYGVEFSKYSIDTSCSYLRYRYLFILGSAVVSPAE
jgi:hypothetical protein